MLQACSHLDSPAAPLNKRLSSDQTELYNLEKQKLISGETDVDFNKLRWAYRSSDAYSPWDTQEHEASLAMFNAYEDEEYELCLAFANAILDQNYASLTGHFGAYTCYSAIDNIESSSFHHRIVRGLVASIEASGDGESANTPYVTITPSEMRSFMQIQGLTSYRQELVNIPAKYIEKFYVIDTATEVHLELYFDNTASLMTGIQIKPPTGF